MENKQITPAVETAPKKKFVSTVCSVVALCLVFACLLTGFAGCSSCSDEDLVPETPSTADELATEINIDEATYVFEKGIYIGSTEIGGHTYAEARELAQAECDSLIHDFTLTISAQDNTYDYTRSNFKWDNNIEDLLKEAVKYNEQLKTELAKSETDNSTSSDKVFELSFSANKESVDTIVASIASEVDVEPKNASIASAADKKVKYSREAVGYKVNQETLSKSILKELESLSTGAKDSASLTADIEVVQPTLSFDDINGKIKLLASFTTTANNTADAHHNMSLAMDLCDGSVIEPGETWSFSAHAGNTNSSAVGYRAATVISNGEYTQGIGGGVCQASTTIYNAAIRANLTIVERHNHRYPSSYAPAGLDATIAYPTLDLKLKNDTDYPIYIQSYMTGRNLYCNIYGWQDPSFDTIKITSASGSGGSATATRIFYKNGKEVDREDLPSSLYASSSGDSSSSNNTTTKPEAPKATKPATTKPKKPAATKPAATKPAQVTPTQPKPVTPVQTDPVEPEIPVTPQPTQGATTP